MAKVRTLFKREVDELLPVLHETYRLVGRFQKERSERNAASLRAQLEVAGARLLFFKSYLQPRKQAYFDALLEPGLSLSDRIVALDTAVGMMHIEFAAERAYVHRESQALRRVLEASRSTLDAGIPPQTSIDADDDGVLARGIPACPGVASGKVYQVRRHLDPARLPQGCIVVAPMTRPELVADTRRIAGIVTDHGGSLCHAAVVARERGIPCVVGTGEATRVLRNRMLVAVDGGAGVVRRVR